MLILSFRVFDSCNITKEIKMYMYRRKSLQLNPLSKAAQLLIILIFFGTNDIITSKNCSRGSYTKSTYFQKMSTDDVIFAQDVIFDVAARSSRDCSKECVDVDGCVMFTFARGQNGRSGRCRMHRKLQFMAEDREDVPGARSYTVSRKDDYAADNPCTTDNLTERSMRHSHPCEPTKFLQCDPQGHFYVISCPHDVMFNTTSGECGATCPELDETGESNDGNTGNNLGQVSEEIEPLSMTMVNPCTALALSQLQCYHEHELNKTKFIQFDPTGKAWVRSCASVTQWSQSDYTCIQTQPPPAATTDPTTTSTATTNTSLTNNTNNTATNSVTCSATDTYKADPCDHHFYYRCVYQEPIRTECYPSSLFYDPTAQVCGFVDTNTDPVPHYC